MLNSDAAVYGGSGLGNYDGVDASPVLCHGRHHSVVLTLPPLAALFLESPPPARTGDELERKVDARGTGGRGRRRPGSAPSPDPSALVEGSWSDPLPSREG